MGSSQLQLHCGLTKKETLYFKNLWKQAKVEQFFKCLKCNLRAAKVAGIEFSLLTESVSIDASIQASDCDALNNTDIAVSQSKSSSTEEVLKNSNVTTKNQPAQDVVNNINNFPGENKEGTPEKKGTDFRRSQLDSKAYVGDTYKPKSVSAAVTTKGGEKPRKLNLIRIVDNIPVNGLFHFLSIQGYWRPNF